MNENEFQKLMQSMDDDLLNRELESIMDDIEIDMASVSKKAHAKLKKEEMKMKRKNIYPIVAAALIAVTGFSTVYASDISDFIKAFFNKTEIYSTVVDGNAYYLASPFNLDDGNSVENVIFTEDRLQMELIFPLENDQAPAIKVSNGKGQTYVPGGYACGDGGKLSLLFYNEAEGNYEFVVTGKIELTIEENNYEIALTEGEQVVAKGEIVPAEQTTIDWINLGYKKTDDGVQILTSFQDQNLKLVTIGEPEVKDTTQTFENQEGEGIIGSGTSTMTKTLVGYDNDHNAYEYKEDANAVGRPITKFVSDAPADSEITLRIPSIIVEDVTLSESFNVEIPAINEEKTIDKEFDLNLQKMILQNIKRTSETSAELRFALNTGDRKEVSIRDIFLYSHDVRSGAIVSKGDVCVMTIHFEKELKIAEISARRPYFVVKGDWTLIIN